MYIFFVTISHLEPKILQHLNAEMLLAMSPIREPRLIGLRAESSALQTGTGLWSGSRSTSRFGPGSGSSS